MHARTRTHAHARGRPKPRCPAFKLLTYYGNAKERKIKRQGWSKPNAFHVCITSYTLVLSVSLRVLDCLADTGLHVVPVGCVRSRWWVVDPPASRACPPKFMRCLPCLPPQGQNSLCDKSLKLKWPCLDSPANMHPHTHTHVHAHMHMQDAKMFRRKKWRYLILDEAHMIKNWKSQRWQTLLRFNSKRRLLITG